MKESTNRSFFRKQGALFMHMSSNQNKVRKGGHMVRYIVRIQDLVKAFNGDNVIYFVNLNTKRGEKNA